MSGKGAALYGHDGGQAEYVPTPFADTDLVKVSDRFTVEQVLFLTAIFPTGYSAVHWGEVECGETVAVFGCGPVGLMAQYNQQSRLELLVTRT